MYRIPIQTYARECMCAVLNIGAPPDIGASVSGGVAPRDIDGNYDTPYRRGYLAGANVGTTAVGTRGRFVPRYYTHHLELQAFATRQKHVFYRVIERQLSTGSAQLLANQWARQHNMLYG